MYKYKLVQKGVPNDKEAPKKWYAVPLSEKAQDIKTMTQAATENTTTAPIEMEAALDLFGKYTIKQLVDGHTVRLGNLGTLRLTFKSEGVDNIEDFNATMIKEVRILFTPGKEFRNQVLQKLQFQNGGVLEDGINYASLSDYKRAKGIGVDPGDEEEGGDDLPVEV